jgi:glutathione S-transferase
MNNNLPKLITIAPSHYCDKVRWGMDLLDYKFIEESFPPIFHIFGTKKYKGRSVPLLITKENNILKDSTDILKYIDKDYQKLYPQDKKKEIEELEEIFDLKLGPHTRRFAYYYLLDTPQVIFNDFCDTSHPFFDSMYQTFFPVFKILMKKSMNVNKSSAERSKTKILEIFNLVEEKLSDGRKFLTGDKITAADITFASLGAPVIMPKNYKAYKKKYQIDADLNTDQNNQEQLDYINDLPSNFANEIKEFRKTKAGIFIKSLYRMR